MKEHSLLIIDDEPLSLTLLGEHLQEAGYRYMTAHRGKLACDLLSKTPYQFSAIILDRLLPDMHSTQLLHFIKNHSALQSIPVIMLTSQADKKEVINAFQNGIYDFLLKPIEKDLLTMVIKRAIRDSHALVVC